MARPNQTTEFKKTVTPINNLRYIEVEFNATQDEERFIATVLYNKPEENIFPDKESYEVALKIFNENEIDFLNAKKNNWFTEIIVGTEQEKATFVSQFNTMVDANKLPLKETTIRVDSRYKIPAKKHEISIMKTFDNGNTEQFISGKLLNFYYIPDTMNSKQVKDKFTVDIMDFENNERYSFVCSIAVPARKFIDKICSLTPAQLQHNVKISLSRYMPKNQTKTRINPTISILDKSAEHGRIDVASVYETSVYENGNSIAIPQGSESNNEEFLKAFKNKVEGGGNKQILNFYKRITAQFQSDVLIPTTIEFFKEMGWNMEIKDEMGKEKTLKDGTKITEKKREVIYLTPIGGTQVEDVSQKSDEEPLSDDLPF